MKTKIAFYLPVLFAIALSCVSTIQAKQSNDNDDYDDYKRNQGIDRVLADGYFNCSVSVVEPNQPTEEARFSAFVSFQSFLNLTGGAGGGYSSESGSAEEFTKMCQDFGEHLSNTTEDVGCTAGPMNISRFEGSDFFVDTWNFSILCNGGRDPVVNAVGIIVEEMMLVEPGQATLQQKSVEKVDSIEQVDSILRERFQQQLPRVD